MKRACGVVSFWAIFRVQTDGLAPDEVLRAMHRPAVDIYFRGPFTSKLTDKLAARRFAPRVFKDQGSSPTSTSLTATGAWEASLNQTCSAKGDKILVLESGRFAIGWGESAPPVMGWPRVEILKGDLRRARAAGPRSRRGLKADKGQTIKGGAGRARSTPPRGVGSMTSLRLARRCAAVQGHDALLMVDAVASASAACPSRWMPG